VDSQAQQQALRDLDRAYANYFAKRARFPRFASKHRGDQTARIPQRVSVDEASGTVRLPKVGAVCLRHSRPLVGVIKSATVRQDACGDWFVSLRLDAPALVDGQVPTEEALANAVGIDLGLTTYATLSTGEAIANPRHRRSRQRALARAQRALARKQRGSKNRDKARRTVARLHRTVARQRADFQHTLTTRLVRDHDLICVEDLNIAGLARTKLARSFADAAFGELLRQVRYKAAWRGKHVVAVGRFYPSSKTCGACGVAHDRDANAASNILVEGTRLFGLRHAGAASGAPTGMPLAEQPTGTGIGIGITPPPSRRGRPRRETPVDGASDAPSGALRRVKQESHTL
jgi:putative transposase